MITETLVSLIAIALVLFGGFFYFFYKPAKGVTKELPRIVFFAAVFIAGLMLNWAGVSYFYREGKSPDRIYNFGMILSITLRMFSFYWDREIWSALAREEMFYSIAITLCFSSAVLCTVLFAVHLFLKNLWNTLSIFFLKCSSRKRWIIAGKSVHQETLLASLTPEQRSSTIIIPNEGSEEEKKEYIGHGFLVLNGKFSAALLKKTGFFNSKETTLIAVSEDDVKNLEIARTITEHLNTSSGNAGEKLRFTAHIMYTNIERVEHFMFSENAGGKIRFFNPYEITVRSFLFDNPITKFIPLERIDAEKALVKGTFDFLHVFIGFGKINREFLKQSIAVNQILGIDYHALVIDKDIKDSQSIFMNQCRGIFAGGEDKDNEKYFPAPKEKYRIEFMECSALSREMYDTVINRVKNADASSVIVALGDVQLSAEIAMEFRQRCYEERIKEGIALFTHTKYFSPIIAEDVLNGEAAIRIEPFGFEDAILTFDHIENGDMDLLAKHIAVNYAGTGIKDPAEKIDELINLKWGKIGNFKRESNISAALSIRIKLNMMGFDLVYDKPEIQDASEKWRQVYGFPQAQKLREAEELERDADGKIADTIRNNLARLEHQRWNAFHFVRGWAPMPKDMVRADLRQNRQTKEHACITTFEGLDELTKLQAELKCKDNPNLDYPTTLKKIDTMHYDCDLMDCLEGNLKNTKYKIVSWADR
ncbi:hypothetical protein [Leadbettera azotonutricia]|uniref:Ryanodine receptor Ryr domain-containing protein n=1 Tax=Leadbettera azotonutricia (strain ATCC BAA-888 / DSM 13862 / ZAS-9) TaxID=545695 RepID=F5YC39_LEAAZ|nr:hypothetical protein [Leadbettera azotonutricia]AEF80211.1 hypothetical protein TREAZ_1759 [Leadbettera azotonutricia ZAS-9]